MDRVVLSSVLLAVPAIVLVYLVFRIASLVLKLFQSGRIADSLSRTSRNQTGVTIEA